MGSHRMRHRWVVVAAAVLGLAAAFPDGVRSQAVLPDRGQDSGLKTNVFGLGLAAGPVGRPFQMGSRRERTRQPAPEVWERIVRSSRF